MSTVEIKFSSFLGISFVFLFWFSDFSKYYQACLYHVSPLKCLPCITFVTTQWLDRCFTECLAAESLLFATSPWVPVGACLSHPPSQLTTNSALASPFLPVLNLKVSPRRKLRACSGLLGVYLSLHAHHRLDAQKQMRAQSPCGHLFPTVSCSPIVCSSFPPPPQAAETLKNCLWLFSSNTPWRKGYFRGMSSPSCHIKASLWEWGSDTAPPCRAPSIGLQPPVSIVIMAVGC